MPAPVRHPSNLPAQPTTQRGAAHSSQCTGANQAQRTATVGVAVVALAAGALLLFAVSYAAFAVVPQFFTDSVTRHNACTALSDTHQFYAALYHYIVRDGAFPSAHFEGNIQANCRLANFS